MARQRVSPGYQLLISVTQPILLNISVRCIPDGPYNPDLAYVISYVRHELYALRLTDDRVLLVSTSVSWWLQSFWRFPQSSTFGSSTRNPEP